MNPSNGHLIAILFKLMAPFQRNADLFFKILFEQSFFCKLNPIILALRIRIGHILIKDFKTLMPSERFYLGGPNSLRSYEPDFAPPLGCYINDCNEEKFVPQGGKTIFNSNLEFRIPFFKNFGIVIFQDLGFLIKDIKCEFKFLTATGLGLRYNTTIGPLRLDVGWRPKCHDKDSSFSWFLTLGQAF